MGAISEEDFVNGLLDDLEKDKLVLPTLPEVALRVRDTLSDELKSLADVATIITTDTALSARLIQIANSPLLRTARAIESVEGAVTRLGGDMIRNLVTSIVMEQMFQATTDATDKRLRNIWEHSTQVAAISSALAKQFTKLKPDMALLAGLVHDIGALPILTRAEDFPEIFEDETVLDNIIAKAHTKIGSAILAKWHFPPELVGVVADHEDVMRNHGGDLDYTDIVIASNLQSLIGTDHPHTLLDWDAVPAFQKLGLTAEINIVEMDGTGEEIEAVKSALG